MRAMAAVAWLAIVLCGTTVGWRVATGRPFELTTWLSLLFGVANAGLLLFYYPAQLRRGETR